MKTDSFPLSIPSASNTIISRIHWRYYRAHVNFKVSFGGLRMSNHFSAFLINKTPKSFFIFKNRMWILFRLIHLFMLHSFDYLMALILVSLLKYFFLCHVFNWVLPWICIYCYTVSLKITKRFWLIIWSDTHYLFIKCNYK